MSKLSGHLDVRGEGLCLKVLMLEQIVLDLAESDFLGLVVLMLAVIIESPLQTRKAALKGLVKL